MTGKNSAGKGMPKIAKSPAVHDLSDKSAKDVKGGRIVAVDGGTMSGGTTTTSDATIEM